MENVTLEATPRAAGRHSNRELRDAGRSSRRGVW